METATKAVENVSFRDRIKGLDEAGLRQVATDEFGLTIDGQVKKEAIVDQLFKIYDATRKEARTINEMSARLFLDADPKEKLVEIKFIPLDFPNAVEEFNYDGGLGIISPKSSAARKKRPGLKKVAQFKLVPQETYKLPIRVIRHLEKLTYRDSKPIFDPVTGMIVGNQPIIKPRFMLQVVLSDEQMRGMGSTQ